MATQRGFIVRLFRDAVGVVGLAPKHEVLSRFLPYRLFSGCASITLTGAVVAAILVRRKPTAAKTALNSASVCSRPPGVLTSIFQVE